MTNKNTPNNNENDNVSRTIHVSPSKDNKTEKKLSKIKNIKNSDSNNTATLDKNKLALIKESYKAIRTNLIFSVNKSGCKKIVISSSIMGEGKSTTSANLATSMAQTDKKVLLIDADLRKPTVYSTMGFSNNPGFTNVLTGHCTLDEAINETAFPNLHVLCAGISVPNPGELLSNEATAKFIEMLEEKYDYILFDTPPVNIVSDALPLISLSDGVVMAVRHNYSTYPEIEKAKKSIEFVNGKILGFVFNDVTEEFMSGRYGKYGKYGKYGRYGYYGNKYYK